MRHRAFPEGGPEAEAKYKLAGQWLLATIFENPSARAWCKQHGVPITRAQGEGIGQSGGFLPPTVLANAIIDLRDMFGAFRRRARLVPMASDAVHVPAMASGITVTWTGENVAATETNATIDNLSLTAVKATALVKISSEIEEDALPDIIDYIANEIAFGFAAKEDDAAFNGDGSSAYGSMAGLASIPTGYKSKITAAHNTYATLDATDLANVMAGVRASAVGNAAWFISQLGFAIAMCRLAGSAGNGYLDYAEIDGIRTPVYLGFPVILTQKLPQITTTLSGKLMLGFGDMYAAGVLGQRRAITIAKSEERFADADQVAIVGSERVHCVLKDLGDAATFGAIAGLFGS